MNKMIMISLKYAVLVRIPLFNLILCVFFSFQSLHRYLRVIDAVGSRRVPEGAGETPHSLLLSLPAGDVLPPPTHHPHTKDGRHPLHARQGTYRTV